MPERNQNKKICVITATYNAEATLPLLIESLKNQSDNGFKWVVADGGSTDKTLEILKQIPDLDVDIDSRPDFGIYDALNRAISAADCDYYVVAGSDDYFHRDAINSFREAANETNAPFITGNIRRGEQICKPKGGSLYLNRQMSFVSDHSLGTLIKKDMHEKYGLYSKRFPIAADQYFLEKAFIGGEQFIHIDKEIGTFGTEGLSNQDKLGSYTESFRIHWELFGNKFLHLAILIATIIKRFRSL